MIHSATGLIHLITALTALLIGLVIFIRPKGGSLHKILGYVYSTSMFTMLITALLIYHLTGSFNFLHGFAILSTLQLVRGLYHAILRKPKETWLDFHYLWMSYSYLGLCAALIAESATRILIPYLQNSYGVRSFGWFWGIVGIVMFAVVGVGQFLIKRNRAHLTGYRPPLN